MAAVASILRRRIRRAGVLVRALSTTTTTAEPALTRSAAKDRLLREYDPDRAVSLLEAVDMGSLSDSSAAHLLSVAARRLVSCRRYADADALLSSHLSASPTEPHLAGIIWAYGTASLPKNALSTFRSAAPSLPSPISPLSFNALLSTFLRCHHYKRVPGLFAELSKEFSITPDATSYGILVKAYCKFRRTNKARQVLDQMREQGISPTANIYTSLIDSMYKQNRAEKADDLWKQMLESGCKPNEAAYNVKVMYYGFNGKLEEVLEVIKEMEAAGLKPNTTTYNYLMVCYFKDGKVEDAKGMYNSLGEKGCSANSSTYKHMMLGLSAHGDFDGGMDIFRKSLSNNMVPDFKTAMKEFVERLAKGGRWAEAKDVVAEVKRKFPEDTLTGWKKLEEELGLNPESGDVDPQAECASEEPHAETESASTEALELGETDVEEMVASKESTDYEDDGATAEDASTADQVPRGLA